MSSMRVGVRAGEVVILKTCAGCGLEKICRPGPGSEFWINDRDADGRVTNWNPRCKSCAVVVQRENRAPASEEVNARRRARHKERMRDPAYREAKRASNATAVMRWKGRPENAEKARLACVRYRRRRRLEDRDAVNEEARMSYALRLERQGRAVKRGRTVIDGTAPRVSAEPFRAWLVAFREDRNLTSHEETAAALDIEPKRVAAVLAGQPKALLDIVDRALLNAGPVVVDGEIVELLGDLYPEWS